MLAYLYINPAYWLIAGATLLFWGRFSAWVAADLENLKKQSDLLWKSVMLATLAVILLIWIVIPNFFISFLLNLAVGAGVIAWYWRTRVQELGPGGHLFRAMFSRLDRLQQSREAKKSADQMTLHYLTGSGGMLKLPATDDPLYGSVILADQLLLQAMESRAQVVELMPAAQAYDLRFSVDGVAFPQTGLQRSNAEPIVQGLKTLARLSLDERRRPQKGSFIVKDEVGNRVAWTVQSSGSTSGERVVLTANEKDSWRLGLDQLGFTSEQLELVRSESLQKYGLTIVTAPRHMGRTTTLYSILSTYDAFTNSIQTLEYEPKIDLESVTVNRFDPQATEVSFAKMLHSITLKDPNVLLVAGCPDAATADLAARFSSDEHRVLLGMQAPDTLTALDHWRRLVSAGDLTAKNLRMIIAQRLVRLLCPTCKVAYQPDAGTLAKLNLPVGRDLQCFKANTQPIQDEKGRPVKCPDCGGLGYRGRTGIFEILAVNDDMRAAIAAGKPVEEIRTIARKNNMMLLVESGIRKFAMGLTSIQEVLRVCAAEKQPQQKAAAKVPNPQKQK